MPVPTGSGSARNSRKWPAPVPENLLTLPLENVQYFTMPLRVAEGSFLAAENVGTRRNEHVFDTG